MTTNIPCYCCSQLNYSDCCEPLLSGHKQALTPEALMRSRYSAFRTQDIDYIITTTHPSLQQVDDAATLKKTIATTHWHGLKVIRSEAKDDAEGIVEFCAFYSEKKSDGGSISQEIMQLHEVSNFTKIENFWKYHQGEHLPDIKLGRNDLCYCGSGKKIKKCPH